MAKTKSDAISYVAEKSGLTKAQAEVAVNSLLDFVVDNSGDQVTFIGFGTFKTTRTKDRTGKDPKGNTIQIASKVVMKFKPGKAASEKLNR